MSSGPGRSRWIVIAGVAALAAVAVAAVLLLGDGDDTTTPAEETVLPLLGTPGDVPRRAALAVKVDDTERGRPQTGLGDADVVFEEVVEGGLTRLLAVFHSRDPATVGPVRSARSTDLFILAELGRPLFAWSGANPTFAAAVEAADLIDVGVAAAPDAYRRADDRPAPYNLFADPEQLRDAVEDDDGASTPPEPLFRYREPGDPLDGPGTDPASGFRAGGSGEVATEIEWSWDDADGVWLRTQDGTPHVDSDGARITATNVVVRATPYRDSGVRDSVGAVVPEADAVGEGDAWLLADGRAQRATWRKPAPDAPTEYLTAEGEPLRLTPGPTWVEVLPPGAGDVVP